MPATYASQTGTVRPFFYPWAGFATCHGVAPGAETDPWGFCPEAIRLRMFRDWLRTHPDDRAIYEDTKRTAVPGGGHVMDYNARKQHMIHEIYDRLFHAAGMK